jgi:hypothetical protein
MFPGDSPFDPKLHPEGSPKVAQHKQKGLSEFAKPFMYLVAGTGFEPVTFGL